MRHRFIKSNERRKIAAELREIYGVPDLPYLLLEAGKQRIKAFSGHLSKEEILKLSSLTQVDTLGMYILSLRDNEPRLNFDAVSLLRDFVTKNIIPINEKQFQLWIRGYDLEFPNEYKTFVALKYKNDLVGVGKSNGQKIFNYIPRERKVKNPLPAESTA